MPIAMTRRHLHPAERAKIQGWLASVWGVWAIVGPALGAFLAMPARLNAVRPAAAE